MKNSLLYFVLPLLLINPFASFAINPCNISGKVIDKKTGEELIGVTIIVEGTAFGAITDFEGKYRISGLKPGVYTLIATYVSYNKKIIKGIEVKDKEMISLNFSMEESSKDLQEYVVQADFKKESASALLIQQKNATSVSSGVSSDLIRKTPDRTTAYVIKRISGASIQDNKFAIIRGLSDRYNMGVLNGAPLPSTESDRKAFSMDIIPASVIDNIQIVKGATPELPGDFAGGVIQINTKDIPDENKITINFGAQYHSLTTFKSGLSGIGSSTDWLGYDNNSRTLPENIMSTDENKMASLTQKVIDTKQFNNNFEQKNVNSFSPNYSLQLSASKRLKLFKNDFGIVFAWSYNNSNKYTPFRTTRPSGAATETYNESKSDGVFYDNDRYTNTVINGGVLNLAYKVGNHSKFMFKNLFTLTSEDQTVHQTGYEYTNRMDPLNSDIKKYDNNINYYQMSRMFSSQFIGEHLLSKKLKLKFKYNAGLNNIHREVPDYRRILYQSEKNNAMGDTGFSNPIVSVVPNAKSYTPLGSGRYFSGLDEKMYSVGYDVSIPLKLEKVAFEFKAGGYHQWRDRQFQARSFMYTQDDNNYDPSKGDLIKRFGPGFVFSNNLIDSSTHYLTETTQGSDQYTASSRLNAGYGMVELKIASRLRLIGGMRVEQFSQKLSSVSLGAQKKVDTSYVDFLPSINVVYELTEKMNLRASASKTVSRPEFREFAQLAFYEFNYNAIITGNPDLKRAEIFNYDIKYEFFPTAGQLFSVNPFYKKFVNPIEAISLNGATGINQFTYWNAPNATSYGVEFEGRINLASINKFASSSILKNITIFANYAWIASKVTVSDTNTLASAVSNRSLQGQSNYVFNAGLMYSEPKSKIDISLTGNEIGRRIAFVNDNKYMIIWEDPRTVIDFSISKTFYKSLLAKVTLGDILAQPVVFYNDLNQNGKYDEGSDATVTKYKYGYTVQFSLGYSF